MLYMSVAAPEKQNETLDGESNKLSTAYDRWHQHIFDSGESPDQESPWYRLVREYLVPLEQKAVLEIACGRGGFATTLASNGALVSGADFSAAALQIARHKSKRLADGSRIAFAQTDAHHLPFRDRAFDVVVSCETVEHLVEPFKALQEMARVAKPGGLLYLTTPNYLNFMGLYLIYDALLKKDRRSAATQPFDRRWLFPQVRRIVKCAGWQILVADGTVHQVPLPKRNPARLYFLERNRTLRRSVRPLAFHYFLLARKRNRNA
jgi:ubiquinone/menaquinone biosynthesis C-methylase UbiE